MTTQLTLFAVPKPFHGHTDVIQRNAIGSWLRLGPKSGVVLFGDEEGTAEVAHDLGARHVPAVERNEFGTPLLSSVFEQVHALAPEGALCYVNSDIVLLEDFVPALRRVQSRKQRYLLIGQCWDGALDRPIDFDDPRWRDRLRGLLTTTELRHKWSIDYFAFSRGLYGDIPPFAVGRAWFDNWLVWTARELGAAVVDATASVTAIHQRHDYAHVPGGQEWAYKGPEAAENFRVGGSLGRVGSTRDANYVLTGRRLRRRPSPLTFGYHWEYWLRGVVWAIYGVTRPLRHRLGIRAGMFHALRSRLR